MRIWACLSLGLGLIMSPLHAAEIIGHAAAIVNSVNGQSGGKTRRLKTRDSVHLNERIRSGAASTGQFQLKDGSKLVIGPRATLNLDRFIYNGRTARKVTVSAIKGAFRFISGKSRSSAYQIRTPVATIGVRGTAFDFYVNRGSAAVMLLRGALTVCNSRRQCRTLNRPCQIVRVRRNRISPVYKNASPKAVRGVSMRTAFPFMQSQRRLKSQFRTRGIRACNTVGIRSNKSRAARTSVPSPSTPTPQQPTGPTTSDLPNNPGNDRPNGRAGESPNGGSFGSGSDGRGDTGQGGGNGSGSGNGNGNGRN
ncbi:MAG: hypothetical protein C0605_06670 [Hyphomicrobiales bacterium]|nr:MAG: hypothetical protein C0605_06670 [Hyphomicrobiales bacterium]